MRINCLTTRSLCPLPETGQATSFSQVLGLSVAVLRGPWECRERGSGGREYSCHWGVGVGMTAQKTAQESSLLAVWDAEPGLGGRRGGSCSNFKWERQPLCRDATNPGHRPAATAGGLR